MSDPIDREGNLPPSSRAIDAFGDVSSSTRQRMWHGRIPMPVDRFTSIMITLKIPISKWGEWSLAFSARRRQHSGNG